MIVYLTKELKEIIYDCFFIAFEAHFNRQQDVLFPHLDKNRFAWSSCNLGKLIVTMLTLFEFGIKAKQIQSNNSFTNCQSNLIIKLILIKF